MSIINPFLSAAYYSGLHRLFSPLYAGIGSIFMLHRVQPQAPQSAFDPNRELTITPAYLRGVIQYLRKEGWDIISLDEMCGRLEAPSKQRRFAVFTLDDGYRDNLEHALPVFESEQAPFAVYVTSGFIDRTDVPWWYLVEARLAGARYLEIDTGEKILELPLRRAAEKQSAFKVLRNLLMRGDSEWNRTILEEMANALGTNTATFTDRLIMNWSEVADLAASSLATIGVHSVSHAALSQVDTQRANNEITACRDDLLRHTGIHAEHFCYPYGGSHECGEREFELARTAGYRSATTTYKANVLPVHSAQPFALPRLAIKGTQQSLRYLAVHLSGFAGILYNGLSSA